MVAFQVHDKPASDIGEGIMEQLISASRRYQKGCEAFDKDKTGFFNGVSDAIHMVKKAIESVPRHVKAGLRKNLAIMYTCRASALLSSGDISKVEEALRDARSAEKQGPSLNLVYVRPVPLRIYKPDRFIVVDIGTRRLPSTARIVSLQLKTPLLVLSGVQISETTRFWSTN
jgi:hypothetical protein